MCKKGSCDYGQKAVLSLEKFDKHELVLASLPPSNAYLFSCFFALILLIAPYRRSIEEA